MLTAAVLVVLSFIAFQLLQIQRELQPVAGVFYGVALAASHPPETPEQRKERIQRNTQRLMEDARTILETPDASPAQKHR